MKVSVGLMIIAMILIFLPISALSDEKPLIGLLTLPQVFGNEPCEKFSPEMIPVFDSPGQTSPIATILVATDWTFPPEGGCMGLTVKSRFTKDGRSSGNLPSKEFAYENPAAIVVDRKGDWFRIKLSDGTGWIRASAKNRYLSLEKLLTSHTPYLTDDWDGLIFEKPMGRIKKVIRTAGAKPHTAAKILSEKRIKHQLWFKIRIPVEDVCGEIDVTVSETIGWIPAYSENNQPALWFYSRGC